ncbi:MAG: hypothetical protein J0M12_17960 [Deltaproteobacteria bacterium]|nr:hypothetical protein [Deltaproteobacteria bacterium]
MRRLVFAITTLILLGLLSACEPAVRDRPFGDLRLGLAKDLLGDWNFLEQDAILLRRDARGWYAMSTMCTKDLSMLVLQGSSGEQILASRYTTSRYAIDGKVLSGPAVKDLPYYELSLDQGTYGGAKDTLYVRIGKEKPKDWRLPVPAQLAALQ